MADPKAETQRRMAAAGTRMVPEARADQARNHAFWGRYLMKPISMLTCFATVVSGTNIKNPGVAEVFAQNPPKDGGMDGSDAGMVGPKEKEMEKETKNIAKRAVDALRRYIITNDERDKAEYRTVVADNQERQGFQAALKAEIDNDQAFSGEIRRRSARAAEVLGNYIKNGDLGLKSEFEDIMRKSTILPGFLGQLRDNIDKDQLIASLRSSLKDHLDRKKEQERARNPNMDENDPRFVASYTNFLSAVQSCYLELKKPKNKQDPAAIRRINDDFGPQFVRQMNDTINPPTISSTPVPVAPSSSAPAVAAPPTSIEPRVAAPPSSSAPPVAVPPSSAAPTTVQPQAVEDARLSPLEKSAKDAAIALHEYVKSGEPRHKETFSKLLKDNGHLELFNKSLQQFITNDPLIQPLRDSLRAHMMAMGQKLTYPDFIAAVEDYHAEMLGPGRGRDRERLASAYGASFDKNMYAIISDRIVKPASQQVAELPPLVVRTELFRGMEEASIDAVLADLVVAVPAGASREKKIELLALKVEEILRATVDPVEAREKSQLVTFGLIGAYQRLSGDEEKELYKIWLTLVKGAPAVYSAALVRSVDASSAMAPTTNKVLESYQAFKDSLVAESDAQKELEAELSRFPERIRNGHLMDRGRENGFITIFNQTPHDAVIEDIHKRVEYLIKYGHFLSAKDDEKSVKALREVGQEMRALDSWLSSMGFSGVDPLMRLKTVAQTMSQVARGYYRCGAGNEEIVDYLMKIRRQNPNLARSMRIYLLNLDRRGANKLLPGVNRADPKYEEKARSEANDPEFEAKLRANIRKAFTIDEVKTARSRWAEYFAVAYGSPDQYNPTTTPGLEQRAVNRISDWQSFAMPMAAVAFNKYYNSTVAEERNDAEHRMVAQAVVRLSAVSPNLGPLLVMRYFEAIAHLAEICRENPAAFEKGMLSLSDIIRDKTSPIVDTTSPSQMMMVNARAIVNDLDGFLGRVAMIPGSALSDSDRFQTMNVALRPEIKHPPHRLQAQPPYAPNFLTGQPFARTVKPPSPFPDLLYNLRPGMMVPGGRVGVSDSMGLGMVGLQGTGGFMVTSPALQVRSSMMDYLYPGHMFGIPPYLPNIGINTISSDKLINAIMRAGIRGEPMDSTWTPISAGLAGGAQMVKRGDDWAGYYGGLGTYVTPFGGLAVGGSGRAEGGYFIGGIGTALPVAKYRPGPQGGVEAVDIDSSMVGYEKMSDDSKRMLARVVSTVYDPRNPSQFLVTVNRQVNPQGQKISSGRTYLVDRDGTIYDLWGAENDFIDTFNYIAFNMNQPKNLPFARNALDNSTMTGNYFPDIEKKGGVMAVDIGKAGIVLHMQEVPYMRLAGDTKPMPQYTQITFAGSLSTDFASGQRNVDIIGIPMRYLSLDNINNSTPGKERSYGGDIYWVHRRIKPPPKTGAREADEWSVGIGAVKNITPQTVPGTGGTTQVPAEVRDNVNWGIRGGIFYKYQKGWDRYGGGVSYESGQTNLDAQALLRDSESMRRYVKSLQRTAFTAYRTWQGSQEKVYGMLGHIVHQMSTEYKQIQADDQISTEEKETKKHLMLWRLIGFYSGLRDAFRLDCTRMTGVDQLLLGYNKLMTDVGTAQTPQAAKAMIDNFQKTYGNMVDRIFNQTYLGMKLNDDFSIEASVLSLEEGERFIAAPVPVNDGRIIQNANMRALWTWDTGFVRAYASIPTYGMMGGLGGGQLGMIGAGVGQDIVDELFMKRIAAGGGILYQRGVDMSKGPQYQTATGTGPTTNTGTGTTGANQTGVPTSGLTTASMTHAGWYWDAAVNLYSDVLEDSSKYRTHIRDYNNYRAYIIEGRFSRLPEDVRLTLYRDLMQKNPVDVDKELRQKIHDGVDVKIDEAKALAAIVSSLDEAWSMPIVNKLNEDFRGKTRVFCAAHGYYYKDNDPFYDIGTYVEAVDTFRAFAIASSRTRKVAGPGGDLTSERMANLHAGVDVTLLSTPRNALTMGTWANIGLKNGSGPSVAGSIKWSTTIANEPFSLGGGAYYNADTTSQYYNPRYFRDPQVVRTPEFGFYIVATFGADRMVMPMMTPPGAGGLGPSRPMY